MKTFNELIALAKEYARNTGKIIIVEGFMDVIRAYTIGITNVVAMMGTAVTSFQASLIKRMAKEVILGFDGDNAGAKATASCISFVAIKPSLKNSEDDCATTVPLSFIQPVDIAPCEPFDTGFK